MRRIFILMLVVMMMFVVGCSNSNDEQQTGGADTDVVNEENEETSNEDEVESETESETEDSETAVGDTVNTGAGEITLVKRANDIPTQEDGPIVLNIPQVNALYGELEGDMAEFLERKNMDYIQIDMEVENTSSETLDFYASQATVTTNTGEQLESDMWLSDHIDGTYIGEVKKSGSQFFILENSKAEDIEWVRIIISSPMNEDFDRMGEGIDFKVEI